MKTEAENQTTRTHLAHANVVEGVDVLGSLLNLSANAVGKELLDELVKVRLGHLLLNDLDHALADHADLTRLRVAGDAVLALLRASEADDEHAESVAVGGLRTKSNQNKKDVENPHTTNQDRE